MVYLNGTHSAGQQQAQEPTTAAAPCKFQQQGRDKLLHVNGLPEASTTYLPQRGPVGGTDGDEGRRCCANRQIVGNGGS